MRAAARAVLHPLPLILSGNRIELVVRPHYSRKRALSRVDAGITGFSHIGLRSADPARDEALLDPACCGARVSRPDRPRRRCCASTPCITGSRCFRPPRPGVQHVNHQVESIDDVMRAWYRLQAAGVPSCSAQAGIRPPGPSFVYFEGPDGMVFEFRPACASITAGAGAHLPAAPVSAGAVVVLHVGQQPDIPEFRN